MLWVVTGLRWVTRERVHVDRVASPWLIKKFIDREAEFVFVPWPGPIPGPDVGIPFDFPGVELGHRGGKCTFEAIVEKYDVKDPAVRELAKIVHAADIRADMETAPEARGLEAIAAGSMYLVEDDYEALERGFHVYDALYVYCQLRMLQEEHREDLRGMSGQERYEFLRARIKRPPTAGRIW